MPTHTVAANELAIKALRCPENKVRMVYHVEGHGNAGLKLYVERSGTKTRYYRARVMKSGSKEMPLGRWPDVSIAAALPLRTARHVPDSIATLRHELAVGLAASLTRCPCCTQSASVRRQWRQAA